MCEGNEPRGGERILRRSAAYALLQTRHHGLQPWLHSNAAPRLFGLNQISSEYSFFRAGSGVLTVLLRRTGTAAACCSCGRSFPTCRSRPPIDRRPADPNAIGSIVALDSLYSCLSYRRYSSWEFGQVLLISFTRCCWDWRCY